MSARPWTRAGRRRSALALVAAALLVGGLVGRLGAGGAIARRGDPALLFAVLMVLVTVGLTLLGLLITLRGAFGWPLARFVLIPLGLGRPAAYLARHANQWQRDPEGGAALAEALALLRWLRHDPAAAERIAALVDSVATIGAAGITASALASASRGDRDGARELLLGALEIEGTKALPFPQRIARAWLIADAAERGRWRRVVELADARGPALPASARLLAGAAARFAGTHSPTDTGLWILWLLSPGHKDSRPLLERAIATPRVLHRRPDLEEAPARGGGVDELGPLPSEPLPRALALHAHWIARDPLHLRLVPSRLGDLCRAWDEVHRSGAARRQAEARAARLGILGQAEAIVERFHDEVAADLADLSLRSGVAIAGLVDPPGELSQRAIFRVRSQLLEGVEELAETMESRTVDKRALPAVEEWRAWSELRRRYERAGALGGLDLRRLMFPQVHRSACNFAVWLWNERKETGIAKPIFRWLLTEAEAVGDEAAIDLQRRNLGVKGG